MDQDCLTACSFLQGIIKNNQNKHGKKTKKEILPDACLFDAYAVDYCDTLFLLERQFASCDAETRYMERQRQSKPLFDEFYVWMSETGALPKSLLGVAMQYAATQKKYIERYLMDGNLEISNNRAERSIKPFVIGRKNWMHCNTVNVNIN